MATPRMAFVIGVVTLTGLGITACSNNDGDNGGSAGTANGGSGGATSDPWKKGRIGSISHVKIVSQNGGPVLGIDIEQNAKQTSKPMDFNVPSTPMDFPIDDGGGLPPYIPKADFSVAMPNSTLVVETPPYASGEPPYTVYYHPDGTVEAVSHFPNWQYEFAAGMCFNNFPVIVNGINLQAFSGVVFDIVTVNNRHFMVANSSDCIYELLPQGIFNRLVCGLLAPTAILYDPKSYLLVTTAPGYIKHAYESPPVVPVELWKVTIGTNPEKTKIAELPIPPDYAKADIDLGLCYTFPFTDYALPNSIRTPLVNTTDGGYLLADMGAGKIYKVTQDGSVTVFKGLEGLQIAAFTQAPNDVIYMLTAPLYGDKYDGKGAVVIKGVSLWALDPQNMEWIELDEFSGYESLSDHMTGSLKAVPCPEEFKDTVVQCFQPDGVFLKIIYGQTVDKAYLMVSDTIAFRIFQIIMDMGNDADAGDDGSSGTGSGGEGGSGADMDASAD